MSQRIDEVSIDYEQNWARNHLNLLEANYRHAPFFRAYARPFAEIITHKFASISELNVALCRWILQVLDIRTPTLMSRELKASGSKSERLIGLLKNVGATSYLSGPSASAYLDLELFQRHGIRVEYKSYDYPPYPQGAGTFCGDASILDLLFHTGPDAGRYLKSRTPDRVVVCPQTALHMKSILAPLRGCSSGRFQTHG